MPDAASPVFIGFHGTNSANCDSIIANNFEIRGGDAHWMGPGVYFFGEGISDPITDAVNWASDAALDKGTRKLRYRECAVIEAVIRPQNLLDLRTDKGIQFFNHTLNRLADRSTITTKKGYYKDAEIIRLMVATLFFDVVIQDRHCRTQEEIFENISFVTPNARFILVCSIDVIERATLKVVHVADIKEP